MNPDRLQTDRPKMSMSYKGSNPMTSIITAFCDSFGYLPYCCIFKNFILGTKVQPNHAHTMTKVTMTLTFDPIRRFNNPANGDLKGQRNSMTCIFTAFNNSLWRFTLVSYSCTHHLLLCVLHPVVFFFRIKDWIKVYQVTAM